MAILFVSETTEQTDAQYDAAVRLVQSAGSWPPAGCQLHVAARKGEGYLVVNVWDSQEALDKFFADRLSEALQQAGVELGQANTYQVRDIVTQDQRAPLTT